MGSQQQKCSGGPGSFNLMFANQFERITQVKLRGFILKVTNLTFILPFYERNAITRNGFDIWNSGRGPLLKR